MVLKRGREWNNQLRIPYLSAFEKIARADFTNCSAYLFAARGRPVEAPLGLALATLLQFMEGPQQAGLIEIQLPGDITLGVEATMSEPTLRRVLAALGTR